TAAATLVGAQVIGADDALLVADRDECLVRGLQPVGHRLGLAHIPFQRIGFAGADRRLEDRPEGTCVCIGRRPDQHSVNLRLAQFLPWPPNANGSQTRANTSALCGIATLRSVDANYAAFTFASTAK